MQIWWSREQSTQIKDKYIAYSFMYNFTDGNDRTIEGMYYLRQNEAPVNSI